MSSNSAHSGWEAGGSEGKQWFRWCLVEVDREGEEEEEEDKEEQLKEKREEYGPDPERESPWC